MIVQKGLLNTASNAIQRAAVLLIYIIAARGMNAQDFGVASSLVTLAITVGSLSSLSLGQTANRTLSRIRLVRLRNRVAVMIAQATLLISLASTAIFLALSTFLAGFVTGQDLTRPDSIALAVTVLAISFGTGLKGHLWTAMRYDVLLISSVASAVILFLSYCLFWAAAKPLPLLYAHAGMVITEAIIVGVAVLVPLSRSQSLLTAPNRKILFPVLRFSGLATLNGLVFTPINLLLISMITASLGSETVGRFNILLQIRNAIVFLPNGFASVILTLTSRARRPLEIWRHSQLLAVLAGLVAVPIGAIAYIWRPVGSDAEYAFLIAATGLTAMIIAFNTSIGQAFVALGKLWIGLATNIIWSITTLSLVATVLRFETSGLFAVLVAMLTAYLVHTVLQIVLIYSYNARTR